MNEQLAFWINLIASSTAIIGLFIVAYQLYKSRKAEIRQFHFDTYKIFAFDLKNDRLLENSLQWETHEDLNKLLIGDPEKFHASKNILDFYTLIATAARDKTINRDKALEYWGQTIIRFWNKYESFFVEWRQVFGSSAMGDLEWFAQKATKVHPQYAERLEKIKKAGKEIRTKVDRQ